VLDAKRRRGKAAAHPANILMAHHFCLRMGIAAVLAWRGQLMLVLAWNAGIHSRCAHGRPACCRALPLLPLVNKQNRTVTRR